MAIYETVNTSETPSNDNIALKEVPIYGSNRLGQYRPFKDDLETGEIHKKTALGQRIYEFSNHLGNVLVTLADFKAPNQDGSYKSIVISASDYYPFGMAMKERTYQNSEYRYGFNGKENDKDFGNDQLIQDYGFRLYNPAIAKFLSVDPLTKGYPWYTPYQFAGNTPIQAVDLDGLEELHYTWTQNENGNPVLVKTHEEDIIEYDWSWDSFSFEKKTNQKRVYVIHKTVEWPAIRRLVGATRETIHLTKEYDSYIDAIEDEERIGWSGSMGYWGRYSIDNVADIVSGHSGNSANASVPKVSSLKSISSKSSQKALPVSPRSSQKALPYFSHKITKAGKFIFKGTGIKTATYLTVKDGFIQGRIKLNSSAKGRGLATRMFQTVKDNSKNVLGIKASWLNSPNIADNYKAFMKVYDGTNLKEAAFSTATGRIAEKLGYTEVSPNSRVNGGDIMIEFIKPPSN